MDNKASLGISKETKIKFDFVKAKEMFASGEVLTVDEMLNKLIDRYEEENNG